MKITQIEQLEKSWTYVKRQCYSIVITTESSLETLVVLAVISKYAEPDGVAVQVGHKKY